MLGAAWGMNGRDGLQMTGLGKQSSGQGGKPGGAPSGGEGSPGPERPHEQRGPVSAPSRTLSEKFCRSVAEQCFYTTRSPFRATPADHGTSPGCSPTVLQGPSQPAPGIHNMQDWLTTLCTALPCKPHLKSACGTGGICPGFAAVPGNQEDF